MCAQRAMGLGWFHSDKKKFEVILHHDWHYAVLWDYLAQMYKIIHLHERGKALPLMPTDYFCDGAMVTNLPAKFMRWSKFKTGV